MLAAAETALWVSSGWMSKRSCAPGHQLDVTLSHAGWDGRFRTAHWGLVRLVMQARAGAAGAWRGRSRPCAKSRCLAEQCGASKSLLSKFSAKGCLRFVANPLHQLGRRSHKEPASQLLREVVGMARKHQGPACRDCEGRGAYCPTTIGQCPTL